ncbi:Bacterial Ig-like domain (group 2) [compost metagenome]
MDDGTPVQFPTTAISYSSSRPDVLTVDALGQVTALKTGKAAIMATAIMNGISKSAAMEIIIPESGPFITTLLPEADTYVRKDAYADTNYGTKSQLDVNNTASGYPTQQAYLRFNLAGLGGNKLYSSQLHVSAATTTGVKEMVVFDVNDDSWIEQGTGGMTWNNKPAIGTKPLSSVQVDNAWAFRSLDVTEFAGAEYTGDQRVSLALGQLGQGNYIGVKSRESTPVETRPYLQVITYQLSEPEQQVQWPNHAALTATATGTGQVWLTWIPADSGKVATGYAIYQKTVGESVYSRVYTAPLAGFTVLGAEYGYEVSDLLPGTYVFKVEGLDADGNETVTGPSAEVIVGDQTVQNLSLDAVLTAPIAHLGTNNSLRLFELPNRITWLSNRLR